jgi:hypothetical protein
VPPLPPAVMKPTVPKRPTAVMKPTVPKRGFSFTRQFSLGKRKKVDLQLGDPNSGRIPIKPTRHDGVDDMR